MIIFKYHNGLRELNIMFITPHKKSTFLGARKD